MVRVNLSVLERLGVFALTALLLALLTASTILAQPPGEPEEPLVPPLPLDHFWCYRVVNGLDADDKVDLKDQFQDSKVESVDVGISARFCNPVRKRHGDDTSHILDGNAHLLWYAISAANAPTNTLNVRVKNQFGRRQELRVLQPAKFLAVPTQKLPHPPPASLDHFQCYKVRGDEILTTVGLKDQWQQRGNLTVYKPKFLCNPTLKIHTGEFTPQHPDAHLVCYAVTIANFPMTAPTTNQIGDEAVTVTKADMLCVPSRKSEPG